MKTTRLFWRTFPRKSLIAFLLGVFFIFSTTGFANDIVNMGRQPTFRFVLAVLLSGAFAMSYAVSGFVLRKQFWKAFFPSFAVQFVLMILLGKLFPNECKAAAQRLTLYQRNYPAKTKVYSAVDLYCNQKGQQKRVAQSVTLCDSDNRGGEQKVVTIAVAPATAAKKAAACLMESELTLLTAGQ